MIFCDHCFKDKEISSIIRSVSVSNIGECPVCHHKNGHLYDTSAQTDLTSYFEDLLDIYTPKTSLPDCYPKAELRLLIDELEDRWNIFADISRTQEYEILRNICSGLYKGFPSLFTEAVGIPELYDDSYLKNHALLRNNSWDQFVTEIKTQNRFHSKLVNFDILERYCSFIRKTYRKGTIFYRARISPEDGYPIDQMSAPPSDKSTAGRVNARGITCLYIAKDQDTALHEVRAGLFDFVSVGTFKLKEDITIVNLRAITSISPFMYNLDPLNHAINKQYLERLDAEMSRPLRRSDSTLDYVPTQYIADFIKSIEHNNRHEYDGIEYNSTTYPDGYNLAIFNPDLFQCTAVNVYRINSLSYNYQDIQDR